MTDALRSRLAADGVVGPQAALILAMAHDLPAGVEVWATTSTVAELAARLETSPRTVRRWRQDLPELSWCELTSTRQGYMLRIRPDGDGPSHTPARTSSQAPPQTPPRALQPEVVTVEDARTLLGQIAATVRTLCGQYPAILDDLPGQDAAIMRSLIGQDAVNTRPLAGQHEDIMRSLAGHHAAIEGTLRGHYAATSHAHARTDTPPAHAPVILKKDSLRSSFYASQPRAHEGAHEASEPADDNGLVELSDHEQLVAWLTAELDDGALDAVRSDSPAPSSTAIERTARALLEHLSGVEAAQALVLSRIDDIASRDRAGQPSDRSTLLSWLRSDAANPTHRGLAEAAILPAAAPAVVAIAPTSRPRREKFRAPQFEEAYAVHEARKAQAAPAPQPVPSAIDADDDEEPATPDQVAEMLAVWRQEMEIEPHLRDRGLVESLAAALGELAQIGAEPAPSAEIRTEVEASTIDADEQPEPDRPVVLRPDSSPYAPLPRELMGYRAELAQAPKVCLDMAAIWPGLVDAVRVAGDYGHRWALWIDAVQVELDGDERVLRLGLDDAQWSELMGLDGIVYKRALMARLDVRTGLEGWRLEQLVAAQEVGT